jgi:hypothetical protein
MTKKEKLEALDTLVLDRMLDIMSSRADNALQELSDLSVPMNFLKMNQVLSDKPKSTVETDTKKRLDDAKKRREENTPE